MLLLVVPTHASGHLRLLPSLPGSPIATSNKLGAPSLSHKKRGKKIASLARWLLRDNSVHLLPAQEKEWAKLAHTNSKSPLFFHFGNRLRCEMQQIWFEKEVRRL